MASSFATPPKEKYDVFISFRGTDTRKAFTSHLEAALIKSNIDTYTDYRLEKGEELEPALLKAIKESKVYVIIFSEDYASSIWCLKELAYMMECEDRNEHYIVPVFYDIEPSVVRHQKERYQIAFSKHEERLDLMDEVLKWKEALKKTANRSGFSSTSKTVRDDNDLVEQVVRDVLEKLNNESSSNLTDRLVGVESRVESIVSGYIIPNNIGVRFTTLWGMGGIGKTTLANAVFHKLSSQFEACCFLDNIRERSGNKGNFPHELYQVRNELLRHLLRDRDLAIFTPTVDSYVKRRLKRTKVLVVLDDVNNLSQLEVLAGDEVPFGPGSRIIITSRDIQPVQEMQRLSKVDDHDLNTYKVEGLNGAESKQFFHSNSHIDLTENLDILDRVLSYTAGVPLALKVLSSQFLQCKTQDEMELMWDKLRKFPKKELQNVYRSSYEGLGKNEREIFLDIACFHKREKLCDTKRILAACGLFPDGIGILIAMSLVSLKDDCIWMHDVIQEMAIDIVNEECVEEPGNRSRLHNSMDVSHVLENNTGTAKVQSIYLRNRVNRLTLCPQAFTMMHNLRFLKLTNRRENDEANLESLPKALKFLFWDHYPLESLPSKFHPNNLVELHMPHSKLQRLWNEGQNPENLKIVDLSYSRKLVEVAFLSNCINIESIKLQTCINLVRVPDLTESVYIQSIDLSGCGRLVQVPDLSKSVNIESINLQFCGNLETVPSYFKNFTKLIHLSLAGCKKVSILPEIPSKIKFLELSNTRITSMPSSICSFEKLVTLNLRGCDHVINFPSCQWKMKSLNYLYLSGTNIEEVPPSIECMTGLISVDLSGCKFLVSLPTNICKLKSLERLDLTNCFRFTNFPEILEPMEHLQYLGLRGTNIRELHSSVGNLVGLVELDLSRCSRLTLIPDSICNLNRLEKFSLSACVKLKALPLHFSLNYLTSLKLESCTDLHEIPDCFDSLPALESLDLTGTMIETIPPTIKQVSGLKSLRLLWCEQLQSLPELPCLLEELDASGCTSLKTVSVSVTTLTDGLDQIRSGKRQERTSFVRCCSLDTNARRNIIDDAHHRIMRMATACNLELVSYGDVVLECEGSEIPEWFSIRTEGSSMIIKLPMHWSDTKFFLGFALSVVFPYYSCSEIQCEMILKTNNGECHSVNLGVPDKPVRFYNVMVWYKKLGALPDEAKCSTEASFHFTGEKYDKNYVRRCGVCFLYRDAQDDVLKFEVSDPQQVTRSHTDDEASASQVPGDLESNGTESRTDDEASASQVPGDLESNGTESHHKSKRFQWLEKLKSALICHS